MSKVRDSESEDAEIEAMYAVIQTGGKQYRVQPGETVVVEKLAGNAGTRSRSTRSSSSRTATAAP